MLLIVLFGTSNSFANSDSLNLLKEYSLFSEYHKNHDYESAVPYGWNVLSLDPAKFSKWIYYKMEDILWFFHDSTNLSNGEKLKVADTTLYLYNLALQYFPEANKYFQRQKSFIVEVWLNSPPEIAIAEYVKAIELDPEINSYYYNRLGQLYKNNATDENDYKEKAIDIYSFLSEREPDNPVWNAELESMVDDIGQLVTLAKKSWDLHPDDLSKGWKYVSLCLRAQEYDLAIEGLEVLTKQSPSTVNYWVQLASLYHKNNMLDKAIDAYKKLIELDSGTREHYLNLGIAYKDKGNFAQARVQYQKANDISNGWGLAVFQEGLLYELSARSCGFDFMDKCVYQLAVDTYRKAANMDPSLAMARERISALSGSVPTKEDYFFRQYKSGQTIQITGNCYGWIGRSITVP